jgi:hypothetical protein
MDMRLVYENSAGARQPPPQVAHELRLHEPHPLLLLTDGDDPPELLVDEKKVDNPRLACSPPHSGHAIGESASFIRLRA